MLSFDRKQIVKFRREGDDEVNGSTNDLCFVIGIRAKAVCAICKASP